MWHKPLQAALLSVSLFYGHVKGSIEQLPPGATLDILELRSSDCHTFKAGCWLFAQLQTQKIGALEPKGGYTQVLPWNATLLTPQKPAKFVFPQLPTLLRAGCCALLGSSSVLTILELGHQKPPGRRARWHCQTCHSYSLSKGTQGAEMARVGKRCFWILTETGRRQRRKEKGFILMQQEVRNWVCSPSKLAAMINRAVNDLERQCEGRTGW